MLTEAAFILLRRSGKFAGGPCAYTSLFNVLIIETNLFNVRTDFCHKNKRNHKQKNVLGECVLSKDN